MVVTRYYVGASRVVPLQRSSTPKLLGADGVQLELTLRPTLCYRRGISVASMAALGDIGGYTSGWCYNLIFRGYSHDQEPHQGMAGNASNG